jgi:hypothetical protein
MGRKHLIRSVESQSSKNIRIADELAEILVFACRNGVTSRDDALKTKKFTRVCSEATYERLSRLEKFGFLKGFKTGADTHVIHEPSGDYLGRGQLRPRLDGELNSLKGHMKSDMNVNRVVADALDHPPATVQSYLDKGGVWERRQKLEDAVDAIEDDSSLSTGNYGRIIVRNSPKLWFALPRSVSLYNK